MSKFKVNNIYNENGLTLNEIINKLLLSFLDTNCSIFENNDIMKSDIVLNN